MKTLVVFYSFEGSTKWAAQKIADAIDADLLELKPEKEIPAEGSKKFIIGGMKAMFGAVTKLNPFNVDFSLYDNIILGTPVWAERPAPALNTFLKEFKDHNKITAAFVMSLSGRGDGCIKYLRSKVPSIENSVSLFDIKKTEFAERNEESINAFIASFSKQ